MPVECTGPNVFRTDMVGSAHLDYIHLGILVYLTALALGQEKHSLSAKAQGVSIDKFVLKAERTRKSINKTIGRDLLVLPRT